MRAHEIRPSKLVIFDIDDTLVHTQTKVHVVQDGRVVKSLNSHDFTHYKLQPGQEFDFGAFRNAREFFENSKPIIPMMNQLKQDIATGNKVVMVTARADFDDKELFLDTFRKYGVDMSKVHVYRAGNMTGKIQTEEKKKIIIRELLNQGKYTKAIMYDDAVPNLDAFLSLHKEYPRTKFYAWHVSLEGDSSEYQRTNAMKANEFIYEGWIPNKSFKKDVTETIENGSVPAGDPILNDPNLYLLLEHYLGKSFIQWAAGMSPYTPRNSTFDTFKVNAIKPFYNKVASQVKPLAAEPLPDIDSIIRIVFTIPGLVSSNDKQRILTKIKQQQTADEEAGWVWKGTSTQTAQAGTTNEDWNKVNHHDKTNGLSQKAVNSYRHEHPGSKLQTAVTTKPSKLKAGSKAAKRRKSFCARMGGNKGPMKKPNGKPTPKALALRRWNCESIEEMQHLIQLGEQYIRKVKEAGSPAQQAAIAINMKKNHKKPKQ